MENCELKFTEGALQKIARIAMEKGTGARGLRSIMEQVMLDIMYDLPDRAKGSAVVIDENIVDSATTPAPFQMPESKSA